jgi:hypothetical protein
MVMKRAVRILCLGGMMLASAGFAADTTDFTLPLETARLKTAPGVEVANGNCMLCHSVDYISTQPRLNAAQWRATVTKMREKYGAPIATNRVDDLVTYFVQNYGPVTNAPAK